MREILFRGKMQISWSWFEGIYLPENKIIVSYFEIGEWDLFEDMMNCKCVFHKVIPETVGRYIGLTDKNGVKIFEGDIVKTKYGRLCVVIWFSSPNFIGFGLSPIEDRHSVPTQWDLYKSENLEIVGNIYDNPELLNAERNSENERD